MCAIFVLGLKIIEGGKTMPEFIDWGNFDYNEKDRKRIAKTLGLPETTNWKDLFEHDTELLRKQFVQELGLAETTSWEVICKKINIDVTTVSPPLTSIQKFP
ncbi:hypothetical protein KKD19_00045 [Patescibacteria group bacterium]|nr:hypothetical protein [Patescibacteria group bacterium]